MSAKILPLKRPVGSPDQLSDDALIAASAKGDRAALGTLFDRHHECVRTFLFHLIRCDETELDDLVQNTFLVVQRSAHRFQHRSQVKTWILGIARNVARHEARARARRDKISIELVRNPSSAQPDAVDEQIDRKQRLDRLRTALGELSPKLREVFVLVYIQGLTDLEAADALGIRQGAVWKRLHDARVKLHEMIRGVR
jgi:RNA polymerase sigma-70 factor, ECF subfamily